MATFAKAHIVKVRAPHLPMISHLAAVTSLITAAAASASQPGV